MKRKDLPWLPALSLLLACAWNGNILAAEDAGDAGVSDLTRDIMMNGARKYDECLQQQTQAMFNDYEDVRRLTDQAMVNCRQGAGRGFGGCYCSETAALGRRQGLGLSTSGASSRNARRYTPRLKATTSRNGRQ